MVEESETPGIGGGAEGRGRGGEGDLLAERRARRAAESGEAALTRRAEAAEATVQTLERHVASLQQRLREAEEDQRRMAALIEAEKAAAEEREAELRLVKQREYAEQQLRVEAEDRLIGTERDGREQLSRLGERLGADEHETRELTARLEELQRQLAEAEQSAASERAALVRAESRLQARLAELERRTEEISIGLAAERQAREDTERELHEIRAGHHRMEGVLGEVKGIVGRLAAAVRSASPPAPAAAALAQPAPAAPAPEAAPASIPLPITLAPAAPSTAAVGEQRGAEMAEALAAAVERLRARAESVPVEPPEPEGLAASVVQPAVEPPAEPLEESPAEPLEESPAEPLEESPAEPLEEASRDAPERSAREHAEPAEPAEPAAPAAAAPKVHKHSMTLLGRIRYRRKQRRDG
jgi:hypothetical protein